MKEESGKEGKPQPKAKHDIKTVHMTRVAGDLSLGGRPILHSSTNIPAEVPPLNLMVFHFFVVILYYSSLNP